MKSLDDITAEITSHRLFQKTKNVVENITGAHDHEPVYDHLIKTASIARKEREGKFITNAHAKELFLTFMHEEIDGTKRADIAVLTAMLHDTGKILFYRENGKTYPMNLHRANDQTSCPGHEYWGAMLVVPEILKPISLSDKVKKDISYTIRLHDALMHAYFQPRMSWSTEDVIQDIKSKAEGKYKEVLFNIYCDLYTAPSFAFAKPRVEEIFSTGFCKRK